jgi:hypothetical protein
VTTVVYENKDIYIYIGLKFKPNSVRIRFLICQIFVLPSTGFELTPLIHCSNSKKKERENKTIIYVYSKNINSIQIIYILVMLIRIINVSRNEII